MCRVARRLLSFDRLDCVAVAEVLGAQCLTIARARLACGRGGCGGERGSPWLGYEGGGVRGQTLGVGAGAAGAAEGTPPPAPE